MYCRHTEEAISVLFAACGVKEKHSGGFPLEAEIYQWLFNTVYFYFTFKVNVWTDWPRLLVVDGACVSEGKLVRRFDIRWIFNGEVKGPSAYYTPQKAFPV